jgi:broad specificity phosphatase PhoE
MQTIVLARHGKPDWSDSQFIAGSELDDWLRGRDAAPIVPSHPPSPELRRIARSAGAFAASPLARSLQSLHLLVPEAIPYVDKLFREADTPAPIRSPVPLPAQVYSKAARLAWYAGWSPDVESYDEARRRAERAADLLIELAPEKGPLLLVGHGIFNGLVGARLRKLGFEGPRFRPRRLWAFGVYRRRWPDTSVKGSR